MNVRENSKAKNNGFFIWRNFENKSSAFKSEVKSLPVYKTNQIRLNCLFVFKMRNLG